MRKPIIILLFCFVISFPKLSLAIDVVTMALVDQPPLMSEKMKDNGIDVAIAVQAFKKVNIETKSEFFPPPRAYTTVEEGLMDVLVGWVWSEDRSKVFHYSDPILKVPLVFFHMKSFKFDWKTYDDLKDIPIGIIYKNYYTPKFHKALDAKKLDVQIVSYDKHNFDKLFVNRIKLFPHSQISGYYIINSKYNSKKCQLFTHHPKPLKISIYHMMFPKINKKSKNIVKLFNEGLRKLKESGEYDKILEKYNLTTK